jgi:uncharacterized protein DUF4258
VPNTADEVLAECHAAGRAGIFILSDHALDRANERNIRREDIRNALSQAAAATLPDNGRWLVTGGADLDGDAVTLVIRLYRGLVNHHAVLRGRNCHGKTRAHADRRSI